MLQLRAKRPKLLQSLTLLRTLELHRPVTERVYHTYILDHWKELQAMTLDDMKSHFNELGKRTQEGNKMGGYTISKDKLLRAGLAKEERPGLCCQRRAQGIY